MTATPNFDDLTPPDVLISDCAFDWHHKKIQFDEVVKVSYRAGARHGWEQARQLWPEPITDRPPTEADGDVMGNVAISDVGFFYLRYWATAAECGCPWLHTPRWQPRPEPTLKDAVDSLAEDYPGWRPDLQAVMRRALEQAGEGQA